MPKHRIRDVVILLPGITGSVLQKDDEDLWAPSGSAITRALFSMGKSVQELRLRCDDPDLDDLGDGIRATRLVPDTHIVPGIIKVDGYTTISRLITDRFKVVKGNVDSPAPANYYEFAYDWRRDNRVSARRLKALIEAALPRWREHSGADDAKVILIAHSMGGLVSRYYLECMEGWRECRALITFGTPYRGSLNALGYLANGYKKVFMDLTEVLRSCTAVYQLLPIYKVIRRADGDPARPGAGGNWLRVTEAGAIDGINAATAQAALAFHREIEAGVDKRKDAGGDYTIVPIVGVDQKTQQAATLNGRSVEITRDLPDWIDARLSDGDGTVPRVSAIPIELSDEFRETFFPGRHGALQKRDAVLADLYQRITQMQVRGMAAIRAPAERPDLEGQPALSVDLDDLYLTGEPITIQARALNVAQPPDGLVARIEPIDPRGPARDYPFDEAGDGWSLKLDEFAAGLYRVEVRTRKVGPAAPAPIEDIFEVMA